MDLELKNNLIKVCSVLINELENNVSNTPFGSCYLLGHCLSEGLTQSGNKSREVSGNLILWDKNMKSIVYGKHKYKGNNVGYYHTWCVLETEEEIIIDPSLKYNRIFLKKNHNIKLYEKIPDFLVTDIKSTNYYKYIEDDSLVPNSKKYLKTIDPELIKLLILVVSEEIKKLMDI